MIRALVILLMLLAAPMAQARVVMLGCEAPLPAQQAHDCCPSQAQASHDSADPVDEDCCELSIDFAAQDHLFKLQLDAGAVLPPSASPLGPRLADGQQPPATGPPPSFSALDGRLIYQRTARQRV